MTETDDENNDSCTDRVYVDDKDGNWSSCRVRVATSVVDVVAGEGDLHPHSNGSCDCEIPACTRAMQLIGQHGKISSSP